MALVLEQAQLIDNNHNPLKAQQKPNQIQAKTQTQSQTLSRPINDDKTCILINELWNDKNPVNLNVNQESCQQNIRQVTQQITATANPLLADIPCQLLESGELLISFGSRLWRVRGWQKNHSGEVMKINLQVVDNDTGVLFVDSLDMYCQR